MSLLSSDYEERVLHFIRDRKKSFTVRDVADGTKIKPGTAGRIISAFEDLELVSRIPISHELCFRYDPSPTSKTLRKVKDLSERADEIKRQRKLEVARNAQYVRARG